MTLLVTPSGVELQLDSRAQKPVRNWHNPSAPLLRDLALAQNFISNYPTAIHRKTAVSYGYNCHGLVFGSRRTQITSSSGLRSMMSEDGYSRIQKHDVLPGDIVVYIGESGDLEHSGMVLTQPKAEEFYNMKILSKWGSAHEVIHDLGDCPYESSKLEFYRLIK